MAFDVCELRKPPIFLRTWLENIALPHPMLRNSHLSRYFIVNQAAANSRIAAILLEA
jgi:hypothetical protein